MLCEEKVDQSSGSTVMPARRRRAARTAPKAVAGVNTPPKAAPPGSAAASKASASAASQTKVVGWLLLAAALAGWLSPATWSAQDPSLTHATSSAARNWLGQPGAIVSDLLLQTLGFAAIFTFLGLAGPGLAPLKPLSTQGVAGSRPVVAGGTRRAGAHEVITLALSKGRIFDETLPRLANAGIPIDAGTTMRRPVD